MSAQRRNATVDMTAGNSLKLMLRFSLPILLGNLFQQMYTVVDGIVVGKSVSTEALAAVGAGFPITYMLTSIFLGLGLGASVLVSQHFGNRDMDQVRRTVSTMNTFLLIIAVPITLLGIFTIDPFLRLLNTDDAIFQDAKLYMVIYYVGMLPQFGYNVNANVLQGIGDSRTPLYILIASSILHIALAVLLVMVLPFGVAGVAWSTVLSQAFSWALSIYLIRRKYPEIGGAFRQFRVHRETFIKTLVVGVPIGIQNAFFALGMMVMQPLINGFGAVFIAGYNAAVKVDGFIFMPVTSLAAAVTTFVGQNIGARRLDRVKEGTRSAILLSLALCVILCAVVIPLRTPLMWLFTNDQAVVDAGNAYLLRVIPLYFISTLQYMYIGVIRGSGQALVPTVATLVSLWLARVPAAYLLTQWFGPNNMHWCYAAGWVMGLAILIPYYYFGQWKKGLIVGESPAASEQ
jgi:putative MATE family efflux protein